MEKIQRNLKITPAPQLSVYEASNPPSVLAKKLLSSQQPIINEANFTGDSLETMESPIGDKQSSPNV